MKGSISITFTKKEYEYFTKRALLKKRTVWASLQADTNKALQHIPESDGVCVGDKERIVKPIRLPNRLYRKVVCVSNFLGLSPAQLVYRIIIAPHIMDILNENIEAVSSGRPDEA